MTRTAAPFVIALLALAPLHVGCGSLLGYESDYGVGAGGTSASNAAGNAGSAGTAGASGASGGTSPGGNAGANQGGNAGANQGGNAGTSQGGNGGTTQGGNGGTSQGGNAGAGQGGNAGAGQGGNAGSTTQGGGAGVGQGGNAGSNQGGGGSGNVNPTDCSVIYVTPGTPVPGNGCSPAAAVQSLAMALLKAKQSTTEIRICQGTIDTSSVQLEVPISIRGGFSCLDWTQPAGVTVSALTTIIKSNGESAALSISGPAIGRTTVIERIHFIGGSVGKKSRALAVTGGAKPLLRNNHVQSGKGAGLDFPSIGMQINSGAAPRVEGNLIESGDGDALGPTVASVGLLVSEDAGPAELVGNTIRGGTATLHGKGYGSVGLFVLPLTTASLTGEAAIRGNIISGGQGNDTSAVVELLSIGAFFDETSKGARGNIEIVGGSIQGGAASHDGTALGSIVPRAIGLHSGNHISLELSGVRVYGGDVSEKAGSSTAVSIGGPGTTTIRSSALHAGGGADNTPFPRAISSKQAGRLSVSGSTLFAGFPRDVAGGAARATGISATGDGALDLRGNLIILQGGEASLVQLEGTCALPTSEESRLAGNAFVFSRKSGQTFLTGTACPMGAGTTMLSFSTLFNPKTATNFRVTPGVSGPSDIGISCMGDSSCVQAALTDYSAGNFGRSQVLDLENGGFTPKSCVLGKGSIAIDGLTTDLLGQPRPAGGGTIGAIELGAGICP